MTNGDGSLLSAAEVLYQYIMGNYKAQMQLSQKFEAERGELKIKLREYRDELSEIESLRTSKDQSFYTA